MVNNIGYTTKTLSKVIGEINIFSTVEDLNSIGTISGNLGLGYIIFDADGTMAVCTNVRIEENPIYEFKTSSISGEVTVIENDEQYENLIPGQLFVDNREENKNG